MCLYIEEAQIQLAKEGDDQAFSELFQSNYSFLYHYLLKLCIDSEVAEDILQETMLKAYLHLRTFKQEAKFSTWLIAIASRTFLDYKRKEKRHFRRVKKAKEETMRKAEWLASVNGYEWSDYFDRFAHMDEDTKVLLLLKYYYEYTYKEIANILDIREGTAKTRVHYVVKRMRGEDLS